MDVTAPEAAPPIAVDIDGTLTDEQRVVDPRAMAVLQAWPAAVIVATGKSFPYPVALCEFFGLDQTVIAENGGVVLSGRDGPIRFEGDPQAADAVAADLRERGDGLGWGEADLVNRWRETEIAVSRDVPKDAVKAAADRAGLIVFDTGFAYHVTAPDISKGLALETLAADRGLDPEDFLAVGDSENDASMLRAVGRSAAVANADESAKTAADYVTGAAFADGFLEAVEWLTA